MIRELAAAAELEPGSQAEVDSVQRKGRDFQVLLSEASFIA